MYDFRMPPPRPSPEKERGVLLASSCVSPTPKPSALRSSGGSTMKGVPRISPPSPEGERRVAFMIPDEKPPSASIKDMRRSSRKFDSKGRRNIPRSRQEERKDRVVLAPTPITTKPKLKLFGGPSTMAGVFLDPNADHSMTKGSGGGSRTRPSTLPEKESRVVAVMKQKLFGGSSSQSTNRGNLGSKPKLYSSVRHIMKRYHRQSDNHDDSRDDTHDGDAVTTTGGSFHVEEETDVWCADDTVECVLGGI